MIATFGKFGVVSLTLAMLVACVEEPPPRSFVEFMDDSLAREGVLARCNADREATANDPECMNARRAAAAIAARDEAGQREHLEAQSEARLLAARQRADAQIEAERQAALAAEAERQSAYEAQFEESNTVQMTAGEPEPPPVAPPMPPEPASSSSALLEPVTLPSSVRPPLTTVTLPRGAKPIEYEAPGPRLEEIELPPRLKTID
jgi:hypothetical protein